MKIKLTITVRDTSFKDKDFKSLKKAEEYIESLGMQYGATYIKINPYKVKKQ